MFSLSNFAKVENVLIDKVVHEANLLRTKTFLNGVSVPLSRQMEALFDDAGRLIEEADVYAEKTTELLTWSKTFEEEGHKRIENLIKRLTGKMDDAIEDFSEDVDEDDDDDECKEKLQDAMSRVHVDRECQKCMCKLGRDAKKELHKFSDDMMIDLKLSPVKMNVRAIDFEVERNYDTWFELAAAAVPFALGGIPGLFASAIAGIAGFCLDSRSEKEEQARKELRKELRKKFHRKLGRLKKKLIEHFDKEIVQKGIQGFCRALEERRSVLLLLAKQQSGLSGELTREFSALSEMLLAKTAEQAFQGKKQAVHCREIVRLPGQETIVIGETHLLPEQMWTLADWLDEPLRFLPVSNEDSKKREAGRELLAQTLVPESAWRMKRQSFDTVKPDGRAARQQVRFLAVTEEAGQQKAWMKVKPLLQQGFACPVLASKTADVTK